MFRNQGDILEVAEGYKVMSCPRCRSLLAWSEESLIYFCPNKKCRFREPDGRHKERDSRRMPPSASLYWLVTVAPPPWFVNHEI